MCTGLELMVLGGLGIGGGTYLQNRSMESKQDAADKYALAGLIRQDAYDRQREGVYKEALGEAGEQINQEALDAKAAELADDLRANVALKDMDYGNAPNTGASTAQVLQDLGGRQRDEGQAYLDLLSDAQGRLGAWGDNMWQAGDELSQLAWDNDRLLTDAGIDANLTQAQAEHAYNTTGNKTAMAGNIATQLGAMALTQGAFNMGAGAPLKPAPDFKTMGVPMATPTYNPYMTLQAVA